MENRLAKGEVPVVLPTGNYMPLPTEQIAREFIQRRRRRRMSGALADAATGLVPMNQPDERIPPRLPPWSYAAMLRMWR